MRGSADLKTRMDDTDGDMDEKNASFFSLAFHLHSVVTAFRVVTLRNKYKAPKNLEEISNVNNFAAKIIRQLLRAFPTFIHPSDSKAFLRIHGD
ncbi:hypothetical protein AVEN_243109-1 [Araneus ventricosus]|uniref:Uncharacterized protein n=1 Tax=Araneus ventricosus TaxID=182803 RepID=A0A4Y2VCJ4_ARAVE|nr:hypothetical protein AVEN_243109-1 [Araneus ventricosus]